jgi:hypothetical protein
MSMKDPAAAPLDEPGMAADFVVGLGMGSFTDLEAAGTHNLARFLLPGVDPADVNPVLARKRDQENAAFAAKIAAEQRVLAM